MLLLSNGINRAPRESIFNFRQVRNRLTPLNDSVHCQSKVNAVPYACMELNGFRTTYRIAVFNISCKTTGPFLLPNVQRISMETRVKLKKLM